MKNLKTLSTIVFLMLGVSFSSCNNRIQSEIEGNKTMNKDVSFEISDQSSLKEPLSYYLNSYLRSGDTNVVYLNDYDLKKTETIVDLNSNKKTYAVPSLIQDGKYLAFSQIGDDITSFLNLEIEQAKDNTYKAIVKDEFGNFLFSGNLDPQKNQFTLTEKSPNLNTNLRASASHWGCSIGFWGAGTIVGYSIGLINPIAGLAVGFAYHVLGDWACGQVK